VKKGSWKNRAALLGERARNGIRIRELAVTMVQGVDNEDGGGWSQRLLFQVGRKKADRNCKKQTRGVMLTVPPCQRIKAGDNRKEKKLSDQGGEERGRKGSFTIKE